ncbi:MAG: hypothetical protein ACOH5I_09335 [Oligoflexus sp.]
MNLMKLKLSKNIFLFFIVFINQELWTTLVPVEASEGRVFSPIILSDQEHSNIAVVKWLAFGSGCRTVEEVARKDRDVAFDITPRNSTKLTKLKFDISFPQYSLASGKQLEKNNMIEMYSECALRFAIKGQPGRWLKRIEGVSELKIQKDIGSSLLVINELRFGQFGSDEKKFEYDKDMEVKTMKLDLQLAKDLVMNTMEGRSSCGTDQILNYDFTIFAKKPTKDSQVSVSLASPKKAILRLEYEDCQN